MTFIVVKILFPNEPFLINSSIFPRIKSNQLTSHNQFKMITIKEPHNHKEVSGSVTIIEKVSQS